MCTTLKALVRSDPRARFFSYFRILVIREIDFRDFGHFGNRILVIGFRILTFRILTFRIFTFGILTFGILIFGITNSGFWTVIRKIHQTKYKGGGVDKLCSVGCPE